MGAGQFQVCWYFEYASKRLKYLLGAVWMPCPYHTEAVQSSSTPHIIQVSLLNSEKAISGRRLDSGKCLPLPLCFVKGGCRDGDCPVGIWWSFIFTNKINLCVHGTKFLTDISHWIITTISTVRNYFTLNVLTQNLQLFPGQNISNLGRFVTTRSFSCCLSVLLRPEIRTLFSPVPREGFEIICSSLLKELSEFVSCLGVSADDTRQISLARQPQAEFNI